MPRTFLMPRSQASLTGYHTLSCIYTLTNKTAISVRKRLNIESLVERNLTNVSNLSLVLFAADISSQVIKVDVTPVIRADIN